jgi:uncharacterized RDD family membrane protein YckC
MTTKIVKTPRFPHLAKDPLIVGSLGANPANRLWSKLIDAIIVLLFSSILLLFSKWLAIFSVAFLWVSMEQLGRGQSPGKWLLGLHTIDIKTGRKPGVYASIVRNLPNILFMIFLYTNFPFNYFFQLVFASCMIVELYFVRKLKTGVRVGDVLGSTRVFDYKDEHTLFIEQLLRDDRV